ncbi:MAG: dockerin type I domain-containing protein, partial [Saprospiraceae bacterium]
PMYTYKDMKFTVADGCMKILRDWKVIDWCQYIPNAKYPTGIWTYTQVIKLVLKDSTAYLKCPKDTVVQASLDCKGTFVKLDSAKGFTKCGYLLKIRNTSPYAKSSGPDASGDYPLGTTKFYFIAEYGCGVELKCEVKVTVVNKIPPTPYCLTGIIVALMPIDSNRDGTVDAGMIEVWAKDLDHGSYHKCGYKNLRFSFSSDVREMNRIFTCDQLGKNEVEMWVTDSAGNQSFCKTIIEIQNNNARIPDCKRKDSLTTRPPTLSINGQVLLENKSGQKEVKLSLLDMTSFKISITKDTIPFIRYDTIRASSGTIYYIQKRDTIFKEKRDTVFGVMAEEKMNREDGNFAFIDVKKDKDYMVVPKSTKEDLEGIDVYDAIVLLRHVLGSQKITSPYKILAADVNNDGQITHADFDLLYSIINGTKSLNQIPRKWRFVPTAYNFQSPTNPLAENIPEYIIYKSLKSSMEHSDFIAIKIGELDDSKTTLTAKELSTRENDFIETNKTLSRSALSINNLFPNPLSQGPFQMDIFVPKPSKLSLTLFNVEGKSLQQFTQTFESGNQQWILEPERELPNGVIFYNLTDGKVHLYGKIQISK